MRGGRVRQQDFGRANFRIRRHPSTTTPIALHYAASRVLLPTTVFPRNVGHPLRRFAGVAPSESTISLWMSIRWLTLVRSLNHRSRFRCRHDWSHHTLHPSSQTRDSTGVTDKLNGSQAPLAESRVW